ncbi:MAG: hypothetical protein Q6M04_08120 [Thermostichus sp. BF3_bins_97]
MVLYGYCTLTVASLGLLVWGTGMVWQGSHHVSLLMLLVVMGGMAYDNGVIAIGRWVPGELWRKGLNWMRFLSHHLLLPLLVVAGLGEVQRSGLSWGLAFPVEGGAWGLAMGLMVFGIHSHWRGLDLALVEEGGTWRYTARRGSPLPAIVITAWLLAVGLLLWWHNQWPWLGLGSLCIFLAHGLPKGRLGSLLPAGMEWVLMVSLLLTERYLA